MTFYLILKSLQGSRPSHRQPRPFKVSTKDQVLKMTRKYQTFSIMSLAQYKTFLLFGIINRLAFISHFPKRID